LETNTRADFAPKLIREIEAAIKRYNMYPAGHPAAKSAAELPYKTLEKTFSDCPNVIISTMEGKLAINGRPLDDFTGKIVIYETLNALNLHSISFSKDLNLNDFQVFLKYFIGKTGGKIEWNSIEDYITENSISGIGLDELRYELVGKDQAVIDRDAIGSGGGSSGGISIASILSDKPELILGLLANKDSAKIGISDKYSYAIDYNKLANGIHDEFGNLSDSDVLQIIAAGLKENISDAEDYDEVDLQETLCNISEILEKRNQADLIPKIKKIVSELHLIDDKYIELILDKKYSRKRLALEELESVKDSFTTGQFNPEVMAMVSKRLEIYGDEEYTKGFIQTVVEKVNTSSEHWKEMSNSLDQITNSAVENRTKSTLMELYEQIKENLTSFDLPDEKFEFYLTQANSLTDWLSDEENLKYFLELLDVVGVYTSKDLVTTADKRQVVKDYFEQIGTNSLAAKLLNQLEKGFESLNRETYSVLKRIQTQAVTLKICELLSHPERALRLFSIRILSEYDRTSPRAFELLISDNKLKVKPEGQLNYSNENWYKLRNIILICGNIASLESIKILEDFVSDTDPRIAEEMILALEKIKSEKACDMLTSYLYFNDYKIRLRAVVALGNVGDQNYLSKLFEAFEHEKENKIQMIPIIARLGKEKSLPFFRRLIMGQKESFIKSFLGKSTDDLKMQVINALTKIPSEKTLKLIEEYKSSLTSGMGSLFKSNRMLMLLEKARRSVQSQIAK